MLGVDEMRAWYGPDHVVLAADRGAIGTLLISDELFRYVCVHVLSYDLQLICVAWQLERRERTQALRCSGRLGPGEARRSGHVFEHARDRTTYVAATPPYSMHSIQRHLTRSPSRNHTPCSYPDG